MVLQWFGVNGVDAITFYSITFILNANECSGTDSYHLWRIRTAYFCRIRSMHVHIATHAHVVSVGMEAGERTQRGREKPCVEKKKCMEEILLD